MGGAGAAEEANATNDAGAYERETSVDADAGVSALTTGGGDDVLPAADRAGDDSSAMLEGAWTAVGCWDTVRLRTR